MNRSIFTRGFFFRWSITASMLLCCIGYSTAQSELTGPKVEARATVGGASFGDNEIPHGVIGGAVSIYVTRRISLEPEVMYLHHSANDQDFIVQPNVAVDLLKPTGRFVPYVNAGVGVIHHRGRFSGFDFNGAPQEFDTSFTSWTASAGVGVKIFVTDRLFIAPEARIGREPTLRGTVSVGYVFSGRERN
jgi:hypothetical protein